MLVKDRGDLTLLIPAPEGVSPDHQELVELATTPGEQAVAMLKRGEVADEVAAATYMAFDRTRSRIGITLRTDNISPAEAGRIGTGSTSPFTEALWHGWDARHASAW